MSERVTMELTAQEAEQVVRQREQRDRRRWIVEGMFLAAHYLKTLGDECAGGSGEMTNPQTQLPFGEPYYVAERSVRSRAAYLSSNPQEINV